MPGYETHLQTGAIGAALAVAVVVYSGILEGFQIVKSLQFVVVGVGLVLIGALINDIDVRSSKIRRGLGKALTAALLVGVAFLLVSQPQSTIDPIAALAPAVPGSKVIVGFGVLGATFLGAGAFGSWFDDYTTHRGGFHSYVLVIPAGLIGMILFWKMGFYRPEVLVTGGGFASIGVVIHLLTDALG